jgi:hypothetical protein
MKKQLLTYLLLINSLIAMGQASEIAIAPTDNLQFGGSSLHHYGVGFFQYEGGYNLYGSGYFGVNFFTQGLNRLRITRFGNVGIGELSPGAKLHVANGDNSYGTILAQATESPFQLYSKTLTTQPVNVETFRLGLKYGSDENNGYISFYRGGGTAGGFLGFSTSGSERIRILGNGDVGIGTSAPGYKLDVAGTIRATEGLYADQMAIDHPMATSDWNTIWHNGFFDSTNGSNSPEEGNWFWGINIGHRSNQPNYRYGGQLVIKNASDSPALFFRSRNEQGAGVWAKVLHNIGDQQIKGGLVVDGTIRAEEVKVEVITTSQMNVDGNVVANAIKVAANGQTADFVFDNQYKLRDLNEVATYVAQNKHLPDVPSAADMEANGVDVAQMNKVLLQKVEELTLYLIAQQKEIELLKEKVNNPTK